MRIHRPGAGGATTKVQCQECGGHKLLGNLCDAPVGFDDEKNPILCSWPQVRLERSEAGILIFMPLCPSTNARETVIRAGRFAQKVLTPEARDYIASVSGQLQPLVSQAIKLWGWKPVTSLRVVWVDLILPRTTCDPTNYWKVSLDTLEKAGAIWNDRYAVGRIGGVTYGTKDPAPAMVFKL